MCGILGMAFQNGSTMTNSTLARCILRQLFEETEISGFDATGLAYVNRHEINVIKAPMIATKFIKTKEFNIANREFLRLNSAGTISIMGHCRAKTKGSPKNNHNNHPIVAGGIVGVHNGAIDNDDSLFNRFRGYSNAFGRRGEVDSEIIFRIIHYFTSQQSNTTKEAIKKMANFVKGSYACAMVEKRNPFVLWLFRKDNPLFIYHYAEKGVVIFASMESAIKNAMQGYGIEETLGKPLILNLLHRRGICINLFSNSVTHFKVEEESSYYNS